MTDIDYPMRGAGQIAAAKLLRAEPREVEIDGNPTVLIESGNQAICAFCRQGKVYSVKIQAPFEGTVRGIKIGDDQSVVKSKLGKPSRPWPMQDGRIRWLYDEPEFMRIDFSDTGRVDRIYL